MMFDALIFVGAFVITALEAWITTRSTQVVMDARKDPSSWNCHRGALWDTGFELVLFIDVLIIVEHRWTIVPILIGAYLGTYWSLKRTTPTPPDEGVSGHQTSER